MGKFVRNPLVFGPDYYIESASILAVGLRKIVAKGEGTPNELFRSIHAFCIQSFLHYLEPFINNVYEEGKFEHSVVTVNISNITVDVLKIMFPGSEPYVWFWVPVREVTQPFIEVLNKLVKFVELTHEDLKTLESFGYFLVSLIKLGEREAERQKKEDSCWEEYQRHLGKLE